jgi:hypothetical protein
VARVLERKLAAARGFAFAYAMGSPHAHWLDDRQLAIADAVKDIG